MTHNYQDEDENIPEYPVYEVKKDGYHIIQVYYDRNLANLKKQRLEKQNPDKTYYVGNTQ